LSKERAGKNRLLIVAPQPPPVGGATINVKILLDELAGYPRIQAGTIDISPGEFHKKASLTKLRTFARAVRILGCYMKSIRGSDAVLLIATRSFIFTFGYFFLLVARRHGVSLFIKPLGGDLGLDQASRNRLLRSYRLKLLRSVGGVFAQTRLLHSELNKVCPANSHYIPGYRPVLRNKAPSKDNSGVLRLVFLSHIERGKGPLLLMEAMRLLGTKCSGPVVCDFYGPVLEEDCREFFARLKDTPNARYCGVYNGPASGLLAQYDVLVFPTYHLEEGHPGVIIEAMHAGIPAISTRFRSSSELINDGENGFLVPVGDCQALASAIQRFVGDPSLRERMGKAGNQKGQEFRSDVVVSRMLEIMLPDFEGMTPVVEEFTGKAVGSERGCMD